MPIGRLRKALDVTVAATSEIDAKRDAAAVEAARVLADQIDATEHVPGLERTKALYLMPHLMSVLKELRATPASRLAPAKPAPGNAEEGAKSGGKVAQMRAIHGGKAAG